MYVSYLLYITISSLSAVYHPASDEHSLQLRWLGPAVPLWDPALGGAAYLSIYLSIMRMLTRFHSPPPFPLHCNFFSLGVWGTMWDKVGYTVHDQETGLG
ncbi:MAG: hypothetical protein NXY57DRAFT_1016389 [Lentinula lateritia]|nr:MAG: hypothetical protein NXY57DRAFT_1016389 [Lentinula lateritia]